MSFYIWIAIGVISIFFISIFFYKLKKRHLEEAYLRKIREEVLLQRQTRECSSREYLSGGIGNTNTVSSPITNNREW